MLPESLAPQRRACMASHTASPLCKLGLWASAQPGWKQQVLISAESGRGGSTDNSSTAAAVAPREPRGIGVEPELQGRGLHR